MQVLSDICLALLPNEQGSKGFLLSGCSDHPPRLVTFLVPQVLNLSSSYEPSSSSGREASPTYTSFNPHVCLYPCTPHTPAQGQSWGSVCQATLLTEEAHFFFFFLLGGPFLPTLFAPSHRGTESNYLPSCVLGTLSGSNPKEILSCLDFCFVLR